MKYLIIILSLNLNIKAATITAASSNRTDVNTAYISTSNGDTLVVPAGISTWTSGIIIAKQITVQGSGTNVSTGTVLKSSSGNYIFRIYSNNARVTNISFDGNHQNTTNEGLVQVGDTSSTHACDNIYVFSDWRIDRCRFYNVGDTDLVNGLTGYPAIMISGYVYGVIDRNEFYNCYGECVDGGADGTGNNPSVPVSLQRSLNFGGYNNGTVFFEDNRWEYNLVTSAYGAENAFDGNSGSRWVIRHNTFNVASNTEVQAMISNHETCAPRSCDGNTQGDVGSLMMEIYSNTMNDPGSKCGDFITQRGGRALIYSNTVGSATTIVRLSNFRSYHRLGCGAVGTRGYDEVAHEVVSGGTTEGLDAAKTTLNGTINSSVTTITLTSTTGFNSNGLDNGFAIRIGTEMINYTGVSGNQLTGCTRGVNGTSAASHTTGANIDYLKFGVALEQINNTWIWANKTSGGSDANTAYIGGDLTSPDYSSYDIRSKAVRPNNFQYAENESLSYTAYPYPHPLITLQDGGGGGNNGPKILITKKTRRR
jgi:hypothetical protein